MYISLLLTLFNKDIHDLHINMDFNLLIQRFINKLYLHKCFPEHIIVFIQYIYTYFNYLRL